jgi:hypothetical protein
MDVAANPANSPFKIVTDKKTVEFHVGDEVMVRMLNLPLEYDDKGKPKKYTMEEVKKLKGPNASLPGYEAKLEDLKTGEPVLVVLGLAANPDAAPKTTDKKDAEKSTESKDKDKDFTHRTVVKLILVLNRNEGAVVVKDPDKTPKK